MATPSIELRQAQSFWALVRKIEMQLNDQRAATRAFERHYRRRLVNVRCKGLLSAQRTP